MDNLFACVLVFAVDTSRLYIWNPIFYPEQLRVTGPMKLRQPTKAFYAIETGANACLDDVSLGAMIFGLFVSGR